MSTKTRVLTTTFSRKGSTIIQTTLETLKVLEEQPQGEPIERIEKRTSTESQTFESVSLAKKAMRARGLAAGYHPGTHKRRGRS